MELVFGARSSRLSIIGCLRECSPGGSPGDGDYSPTDSACFVGPCLDGLLWYDQRDGVFRTRSS